MISIIIRTKNEEKWIANCLYAVSKQNHSNYEVIVVDNNSTDNTLNIAKEHRCKIVQVGDKEFNYSYALNKGIKASKGEYIVCLSGHCIPKNDRWLSNLVKNLEDEEVGGVYGRQEPLPDSDSFDKRDLWITFGLDKKIQKKDAFFHNANSMIRRELWEKLPFDENMNGQEDRAWAKKVLSTGKKIVYEPEASVYHHHGIHQGRDKERCERVVKIIEMLNNEEI